MRKTPVALVLLLTALVTVGCQDKSGMVVERHSTAQGIPSGLAGCGSTQWMLRVDRGTGVADRTHERSRFVSVCLSERAAGKYPVGSHYP